MSGSKAYLVKFSNSDIATWIVYHSDLERLIYKAGYHERRPQG